MLDRRRSECLLSNTGVVCLWNKQLLKCWSECVSYPQELHCEWRPTLFSMRCLKRYIGVMMCNGTTVIIIAATGGMKARSLSGELNADCSTKRQTPAFCIPVSNAIVYNVYSNVLQHTYMMQEEMITVIGEITLTKSHILFTIILNPLTPDQMLTLLTIMGRAKAGFAWLKELSLLYLALVTLQRRQIQHTRLARHIWIRVLV